MTFREETGVPAGSPSIEVDGVRLAVARKGRGPVIVCLHAIGHGGGDFDVFTEAMGDRFEIVRIDWPGQGRSGTDRWPAGATRYGELLTAALDKLGIERPIIIGNSIGGAAAILHASRRPVRALVLCDTGGLVEVGFAARRFCGALVRFFAAGERRAWWFAPAFRFYYRRMVLPSPAAATQRERIIRAGAEIATLLREAWESFRQPDADIRTVAQALDVPVHFAWAKKDRVIPLSLCLPAIKKMKRGSLTTFDAGHAPFLEQPEAFVEDFVAFVQTLSRTESVAAE